MRCTYEGECSIDSNVVAFKKLVISFQAVYDREYEERYYDDIVILAHMEFKEWLTLQERVVI